MLRSGAAAGKRWLLGAGAVALAVAYARRRQHAHARRDRLLRGELRELSEAWTSVDGLRTYMRMSVSPHAPSTPVVFVHRFGASSSSLRPTLERLAPAFNVYAPDLPGHGRSQRAAKALGMEHYAEWLVQWLDATALGAVSIVAHSTVCHVVFELAVRHPERIKRLVLIGPSPHRRLGERAPFVRQPVLYVHGEHDSTATRRWIEQLIARTPIGAATLVSGVGRAVHYSAADELTSSIIAFLSAADAAPAAVYAAERDGVDAALGDEHADAMSANFALDEIITMRRVD